MKIIPYQKALYFIIEGLEGCFKLEEDLDEISSSLLPEIDLKECDSYDFSELFPKDYEEYFNFIINITFNALDIVNTDILEKIKDFVKILTMAADEDENYEITVFKTYGSIYVYFDLIIIESSDLIKAYQAGSLVITDQEVYIHEKKWADYEEIKNASLFKLFKEYHEAVYL